MYTCIMYIVCIYGIHLLIYNSSCICCFLLCTLHWSGWYVRSNVLSCGHWRSLVATGESLGMHGKEGLF